MADRCRVGRAETVVQQDRHVHQSLASLRQLKGLEDRILARAHLYYKKRRPEWQLVAM